MSENEKLWNVQVTFQVGGDDEQLAREHVMMVLQNASLGHLLPTDESGFKATRVRDVAATVHKAEPTDLGPFEVCKTCGLLVHVVTGGNGPTWVHSDTGTVVGSGGKR